jgi:hypothetical protein
MVFCDTTGHHRPFTKQSFRRLTRLEQCVPGQVQTSLLPEYLPIQILPYRAFFFATKIVEP